MTVEVRMEARNNVFALDDWSRVPIPKGCGDLIKENYEWLGLVLVIILQTGS